MNNADLPAQENRHPAVKHNFLLVGLGASAGGIKALKEFFAVMPPDSGMAFVVILHLSQEHESTLHEILQRETQMTVTQVTETVKVEPNNVYVIPPAKHLEMVDGSIGLTEPERIKGRRVPIDRFFRTLGETYGKNSICVVMSGTGSDGTLGLKQIKECNGFAIVQDPADAEYDGMPRSAISTNLVDVVLPVAAMPAKLISVRDSTKQFKLTEDDESETQKEIKGAEALREILTLLRLRTGHDFSNYKQPTVLRRIARHLQIHELPDLPSYLSLLRENSDEVHFLLKNLLINVTNFFRDRVSFETLEKVVVPKLFEGKTAQDQIRVWSAGCATGEEAYSLAILLQEHALSLGSDAPKIQIFASDVDDDVIAEAREGRFNEGITADVSPERLRQFFIKEDSIYRVRKEIREIVLFASHNILRDPPFSRLDLVVCRNVLIYLNRSTQEKVLRIFHFALRQNEYLFLGSSETADGVPPLFSAVDKKQRIYTRRSVAAAMPTLLEMPVVGKWQPKVSEIVLLPYEKIQSFSELHHHLIEHFAPPSVLVNEEYEIVHLSENVGRFLRFAGGEPSNNLLKVVHPALRADLRAALFSARQESAASESRLIRADLEDAERTVSITVHPVNLPGAADGFILVIFDEEENTLPAETKAVPETAISDNAMESVVRRLEDELQRTKDRLRTTIEQQETAVEELKASNEELQAINEELRSASEELETSKEELQSLNEELTTVNSELKDKVEEVTRANSDLQNLMTSTDIGTIFLDRALKIKRYTPQVQQLFNLIASDVGRPLEHLTHKFDYHNFTEDAAEVLQTLQTVEREVQSTGGRAYLARFLPYRTIDDRIDGVVLNFLDITEYKKIEAAVRVSEGNLRLLIESVKDYAIFTINQERRIKTWNSGAEKIFGWTEAEIVGQPADVLFTPEDREINVPAKEIEMAQTAGRAADDRWHVRKDGSRFFVNGVIMTLSGDNSRGFVKIARDLTAEQRAQETLKTSEERLQLAAEAAALGSSDWNFRTNELVWTEKLFEMFGLQPTEDRKMSFELAESMIHPEDLPVLLEKSRAAKAKHEKFKMEYRIFRADDNELRWISASESFFYDEENQLVRGVGVAQDVTERKAAEEIVLRSREELEIRVRERTNELGEVNLALASEIAERQQISAERVRLLQQIVKTQEDERKRIARDMHDHLGQRLITMRLKLENLKAMCDGDVQLCNMVDSVQKIAGQIDTEVDFLARELRPTVLDDLGLKAALDNYVSDWSEHFNIPAEVHASGLQDKRLPAEIETHLYRIVQEALNNSAKHSGATKLDVLIENRDHTIILIIEDNGQGFEAEDLNKRRDKGLGLIGMRERAALMGGTLEIETSRGNGTTIFARIPLQIN